MIFIHAIRQNCKILQGAVRTDCKPGVLVLMLFDGYLRFTAAARKSFEIEDFTKKNEGINNNLIRAQNIVTELQSSLDMSVPKDSWNTLPPLRLCAQSAAV